MNGSRIFGAVQSILGDFKRYYWFVGSNNWNFGHGTDKPETVFYDTSRHIVEYNTTTSERRGVWIDNIQVINNFTEHFNLTYTMYMFTSQDSDGNKPANPLGRCSIYSALINQNNTLIRELIPCYRKSDLVAGMYDRVNDVFYTNAGTGEFIAGPDVNS